LPERARLRCAFQQPKTLRLSIVSTDKIPANLSLHWYLPEGLSVSPSADGYICKSPWGATTLDFTFTAERLSNPLPPCMG